MYDLSVVVPTFNEKHNVQPLFEALCAALEGRSWQVIFVDDDSPDGTAEEAKSLARNFDNIRVIHRVGRRGLAGACIEGILSSTAPFSAVIDADLQHDETKLRPMLDTLERNDEFDIVIGSRRIDGGSSGDGLSHLRRWGSDRATSISKRMLGITASDPMSGFFMVRRLSFNKVVASLENSGFKILADMLAASGGQWRTTEIPYTFRPRHAGESKMDLAVTLEFLSLVIARSTGRLISPRFVLFCIVGFTGVFIQLIAVKFALAFLTGSFTIAQLFGVSLAMLSNFLLNNRITYRDRTLTGRAFRDGILSFYVVCVLGAIMNVAVAELVFSSLPVWAVASISGAIAGALWNFVASSTYTWRSR